MKRAWNINGWNWGYELGRWRGAHCLTQAELATILGVCVRRLGRVERCEVHVPCDWVPLIEDLLDPHKWSTARLPVRAWRRMVRRDEEWQVEWRARYPEGAP